MTRTSVRMRHSIISVGRYKRRFPTPFHRIGQSTSFFWGQSMWVNKLLSKEVVVVDLEGPKE